MTIESIKRNYEQGLITRDEATTYQVIDNQTGEEIDHYDTVRKAARRSDKLDLQYGGTRYTIKPVRPN